jgi:choline transport protein
MLTRITAANMNYTCLVVGGLTLFQLLWYIKVRGRYNERIQRAKEE